MREKVRKGFLIPALALVMAFGLVFGITGAKSVRAAEKDEPVVLADFETGTYEDWFLEPDGGYGAEVNQGPEGRISYQIVPEDYDAAGFGAIPATSDNQAALLYMHSWASRAVKIPFSEPYTVTEDTVLSFRMKVHTPTNDPLWNIVLTAFDSTNEAGVGYKVPADVQQDTWLRIRLYGAELEGLVDHEGKLSGVTVSLSATIATDEYVGGNGPMNVMLDDFMAGSLVKAAPEGAVITEGALTDLTVSAPVLTKVNGAEDWDEPPLYNWYQDRQYYGFEENVVGATDGKAFRMNFCHWRTGALKLDFEKTVDITEISSLKLRMFFHMSEAVPYNGYLILFASDSDGASGTGVALPRDVLQEEWVELEITGNDLVKLADSEGKISGLQFGYDIHTDQNNYLNWEAFAYLDRILCGMPATVTFDDGKSRIEVPATTTESAEKIASPEQAGKVFAGWYLGEKPYDFSAPVMGDIELVAKWLEKGESSDIYGLYVGSTGNLMLYPDHTAFLEGVLTEGTTLSFAAGEKLIFDNAFGTFEASVSEDTVTLEGEEYVRSESVTVTYEDRNANYVRYIEVGGTAANLEVAHAGYIFEGWFAGNKLFDFETNLSEDLTLTAKWSYELETADEWRYATYYADGVTLILKEDGTAKLIRNGNAVEADWFILTTSALILKTEVGILEGNIGKYSVALDGNELIRLRQFHVSFELNGGSGTIERQTFRPKDGSEYLATKPDDPIKEGYIFAGWKTSEGRDFDFDSVLTESITLYASWTSADGSVPQEPGGCNGKGASAAAGLTLFGAAIAALGRRRF